MVRARAGGREFVFHAGTIVTTAFRIIFFFYSCVHVRDCRHAASVVQRAAAALGNRYVLSQPRQHCVPLLTVPTRALCNHPSQQVHCCNSPLSGMLPKEESPILSGSMQCAEAALMSVQTVQVPPAPPSCAPSLQFPPAITHPCPPPPPPPLLQVNFSVSSLSASNLTVDNLSVKNVEYSKVDRCAAALARPNKEFVRCLIFQVFAYDYGVWFC